MWKRGQNWEDPLTKQGLVHLLHELSYLYCNFWLPWLQNVRCGVIMTGFHICHGKQHHGNHRSSNAWPFGSLNIINIRWLMMRVPLCYSDSQTNATAHYINCMRIQWNTGRNAISGLKDHQYILRMVTIHNYINILVHYNMSAECLSIQTCYVSFNTHIHAEAEAVEKTGNV